jgi:myo-inositol 2-dehydrogenase/D-chiro-inositol 1-dehydrogenase
MLASAKIRVGLIGTGRIGRVHAANIAGNASMSLAWVADPFVDGAREVAATYDASATESATEVITSGEVDAIVVASPTPTHVTLIEACVDAGVPALCEKPIDLDIERVDALRAKVAASGVAVALGFNQRFDPSFAEVHRRVREGHIGAVEQMSIVSRDPSPPPADYIAVSGGIFRDMTIHDLDMVRFFLGDIAEVSATGSALFDEGARKHGDFDTVALTLKSAHGSIATILNSRHSAIGYDQRLEVFGPGGLLQVSNSPSNLVSASTPLGVEIRRPYVENFIDRYSAAYARELDEFVKLVRGQDSTSPTFEDGRAALVLADAAQRATETGATVRL